METAISSNPLIALNQLRAQNEELRNELRQVSQTLDDLLAKQAAPEPSSSSTEKRIESAQKLLSATEKEIEILRQQLEAHSFENKHKLEEEIVSTKALLKETVNRNREIQRELKDGANRINIQSTDPEEAKEMRILNEELRVCKEKLKEIDAKYNHQKKQNENALTKIAQLERQAEELGISSETPYPGKKSSKTSGYEEEPEKLPLESREIQALKEEIAELEKMKLSVEPRWRKRLAEIEQEKGYYEESKESANRFLKEKEQEIRMKEFEIKDLKRTIRNLRTKSGNLASAPDLNIEEKEEKPKKPAKFVGLPKSTKAKKNTEETKEEMKPVEKVKNQRKQNVELELEEEKPKPRKISQERKEPKGHSHKRKPENSEDE
ncbi:unnamed protein product [Blepharisma stoltei]|uniref:Uncharacterized protein n=1 Tax=Blepharisma stoltei TaxID=1481888 RepID=A0AAU9IVE0_9CILI|nr:unnamed protein product [Blepharisma stoltei]